MRTLMLNLIVLVALHVTAAAPITATSRQITDDQFARVCVPVLTNIYAMIDGELVPLTKYIRTTAGSITTTPTSIVPAPDSYRVHAVLDDSVLLSWPAGSQGLPNIITRLPTVPEVGSIINLQLVALNQRHTITLDNGQALTLTMHMHFNPRPATPTELLTAFRAGTTFVILLDGELYHVSRAS